MNRSGLFYSVVGTAMAILIVAAAIVVGASNIHPSGNAQDFKDSFVVSVDHVKVTDKRIVLQETFHNTGDKNFPEVDLHQSAYVPSRQWPAPVAVFLPSQTFPAGKAVHKKYSLPLDGLKGLKICPKPSAQLILNSKPAATKPADAPCFYAYPGTDH